MESSPRKTLLAGDVLVDRFEVVRPLFEGGMGCVYEAIQVGLDRKVAIKTLQPALSNNSDWLARFRRETLITQRLTHPNTVRVYDAGQTADGLPYIAMELLDGRTLERIVQKKGALPVEMVTTVAKQVLGSLIEAHAEGIVHRDIKPGNIMLCKQVGQPNLVKVLDFGVAHLAETEDSFKTQAGLVVGTPHYMSPEQARGDAPDERSDIYSLGLTIFEMATGAPPYNDGSPMEIAMQHLLPDAVEIPRSLEGTRLGAVISRATKKIPVERFQTAREMLEALTEDDQPEFSHFADSSPPRADDERKTLFEADEQPTRLDLPVPSIVIPQRISRRWWYAAAAGLLAVGLAIWMNPSENQEDAREEPERQSPITHVDPTPPEEEAPSDQQITAAVRARAEVIGAWDVATQQAPAIDESDWDSEPHEGEETDASRDEPEPRAQERQEITRPDRPPETPEEHDAQETPTVQEDDPDTGQAHGMPINF